MVYNLLKGLVIGVANIIPGVSGGTFALILGIYSRLMESLSNINKSYIKEIFALVLNRKFKDLFKYLDSKGTIFLGEIGLGAVVSIFSLSKLLKYMLETNYEVTYGFFFGLIFLSILIPFRLINKKSIKILPWLVLGLALTAYISMAVDPSVKVLQKSAHLKEIFLNAKSVSVSINILDYLSMFFIGVLAISAMILPGISGSFILLLFGKYYVIISAISRITKFNLEDILLLSVFSFGMIFGILIFVRIFDYFYKKFKDPTLSFLTGLMIGSLYALWPFKKFIFNDVYRKVSGHIDVIKNLKIYTNQPVLPDSLHTALVVSFSVAIGMLVMYFFIRYENKNS